MAVDERRRSELFEGLSEAIGPEQATTMFELLPPAGVEVATRQDVERLEARMDAQFARIDERFERIDERFARIDERFDEQTGRHGFAETYPCRGITRSRIRIPRGKPARFAPTRTLYASPSRSIC
jgi:hypothetical protein